MGLITHGDSLINEVKAWPPRVQIGSGFNLVTSAYWWESVGTPTTALTVVPVSGETGLDAKFLEVGKCVTDAADEGFRQRYTFADEPRIKSDVHLSALVWCGATAGSPDVTVKLVNSDASETVGVIVLSSGDWDLYAILDHVCAGTYTDLQVTKDTSGTFYVGGPITVSVGENVIALPPRPVIRRNLSNPVQLWAETTVRSGTYVDRDLTSVTSALATHAHMKGEFVRTASGAAHFHLRVNWDSTAVGSTNRWAIYGPTPTNADIVHYFDIELDQAQIFEQTNLGGTINETVHLVAYEEWA